MRYLITSQQASYFQKHKQIEFDELLSKEEARRAFISCDLLLQKRLQITPDQLVMQPQEKLISAERDLFREDSYLAKIAKRRAFAEILHELTKTSPVRLAFDYLFYTNEKKNPFFGKKMPLQEFFSVQNLCGFLLLRLSFSKQPREDEDPIPKKIGNGFFFAPHAEVDLSPLFTLPSQMFYLIGYAKAKSIYISNDQDPHKNYLKKLGYSFGDLLSDKHHPIVYK